MNNWLYADIVPCSPWRSAMTLPRELKLIEYNNKHILSNKVVEEISEIAEEWKSVEDEFKAGNAYQLKLQISLDKNSEVSLSNASGERFVFEINAETRKITAFRNGNTGNYNFKDSFVIASLEAPLNVLGNNVTLDIFVDQSSVEIFTENGLMSMTNLVFPSSIYNRLSVNGATFSAQMKTLKRIWDIYANDNSESINEYYTTYYTTDTYFSSQNNDNSITYNLSLYDSNLSDSPTTSNYIIRDIEYFINEFLNSYNISNYTFYYYEIKLNENGIITEYSNSTFIDFTPELKNELIKNFNLDIKSDKIYVLMMEYLFNDLNDAVKDFDFKLFLENGSILDINEDFYADVYAPLTDLTLANYNYSIYFADQGYDIYNRNDKFYNDICSPAYLYNNDITIQDRKIDIYPNDVILCKDNCDYRAFNIEEKRIICHCNLNSNKNYTKINNNFLKEEDNGNFFDYFLDYVNYRILKCYNILNSFDNIKTNYAFYCTILILLMIITINILFLVI